MLYSKNCSMFLSFPLALHQYSHKLQDFWMEAFMSIMHIFLFCNFQLASKKSTTLSIETHWTQCSIYRSSTCWYVWANEYLKNKCTLQFWLWWKGRCFYVYVFVCVFCCCCCFGGCCFWNLWNVLSKFVSNFHFFIVVCYLFYSSFPSK